MKTSRFGWSYVQLYWWTEPENSARLDCEYSCGNTEIRMVLDSAMVILCQIFGQIVVSATGLKCEVASSSSDAVGRSWINWIWRRFNNLDGSLLLRNLACSKDVPCFRFRRSYSRLMSNQSHFVGKTSRCRREISAKHE